MTIDDDCTHANPFASGRCRRLRSRSALVAVARAVPRPSELRCSRCSAASLGALLILLWWLFFSRARWLERIAAIVVDGRRASYWRSSPSTRRSPAAHRAFSSTSSASSRYAWRSRCGRSPRVDARPIDGAAGAHCRSVLGWLPMLSCAPKASTAAASSCTGDGRRLRKNCCSRRVPNELKPLPPAPAVEAPNRSDAARLRPKTPARAWRPRREGREAAVGCAASAIEDAVPPSGRDSADRIATASFAAFASTPIGPHHRRCRCGAGRSAPAGRRSRCAAICSTRRSSAATKRSSRAIACRPASRCGGMPIRSASTNRTAAPARAPRRRFTAIASTRWARPAC